LKILYHHRTMGDGAEGIHISGMIEAFRKLGHEVEVSALVTAGDAGATQSREKLGKFLKRLPRAFYEIGEVAYNLKGYPAMLRAIRTFRPDLVYDRYNIFNDSVVTAARRCRVPVFLEVNTPYAYQRRVYEKLTFQRLASWMEVRTWRRADRVLVVSTPLKEYLLEAGIPGERVEVMPNGVDLELFAPPAASASDASGVVTIGFVGSLRRWHGLDLLMEAAEPLLLDNANVRLCIVGDGPERQTMEEWARSRGLQNSVVFLGKAPHDEIPATIERFDIAVSPRNVFYQSPMKIVEYMAMGKAVLAPDTKNIHDLMGPDREGLVFKPDDADSLREALRRVIDDPELRMRLGAAARSRVERRHTWLGNARRVLELFEQHRTGKQPV
jgi:glycosyltransferase involved in cell wall biosynthesis